MFNLFMKLTLFALMNGSSFTYNQGLSGWSPRIRDPIFFPEVLRPVIPVPERTVGKRIFDPDISGIDDRISDADGTQFPVSPEDNFNAGRVPSSDFSDTSPERSNIFGADSIVFPPLSGTVVSPGSHSGHISSQTGSRFNQNTPFSEQPRPDIINPSYEDPPIVYPTTERLSSSSATRRPSKPEIYPNRDSNYQNNPHPGFSSHATNSKDTPGHHNKFQSEDNNRQSSHSSKPNIRDPISNTGHYQPSSGGITSGNRGNINSPQHFDQPSRPSSHGSFGGASRPQQNFGSGFQNSNLPTSNKRPSVDSPYSKNSPRKGVDNLAFQLLQLQSTNSRQPNVVMSPLSISSLLSMLLFASGGSTHDEIRSAMGLTDFSDTAIQEYFRKVTGELRQSKKGLTVQASNQLFTQRNDITISQDYHKLLKNIYQAGITSVDFKYQPVQTMNSINEWVSRESHGNINNLITSPFDSTTLMTAINVIYFNGAWDSPFETLFTYTGVFKTGYKNISIPMMVQQIHAPYIEDYNYGVQVVALPYKGQTYAMYIVIPSDKGVRSLDTLERTLTPEGLNSIIKGMTRQKVWITVPRMMLSHKMYLKQDLKSLNVNSLFSRQADLSKMTNSKDVFVSDLIHEAVMKITETGTEAAAATGASIDRIIGRNVLRFDRPALIFIKNMQTLDTLFMARVVEPEPLFN